MRGLVHQSLMIGISAGFLNVLTVAPALPDTVIERRLAALEPCGGLKTELAGITFGIDKLEEVALRHAEVRLLGDDVSLSFGGSLSCRTSNNSAVRGNASANIEVTSTLNLADCSIQSLLVEATDFSGTFGRILKAAWVPVIKPEIEGEARSILETSCRDFVGGD